MIETKKFSVSNVSRIVAGIAAIMMLILAPVAAQGREAKVLSGLEGSTSSLQDSRSKALRAMLKGFTERAEVPGAAMLLAQHGRVVFLEGYGWADVETKKPFTVDNMVLIASVTKPLSATCVMIMAEEGKVSLDDKVSKYLPAFGRLKVNKTDVEAPSPTIRQLLSHTSGLFGLVGATKTGMRAVRDLSLSMTESVEIIGKEKLVATPGSRFNYGGANYQVAARIVEIVSGQPFDIYMKQRLLDPLGMGETYFKPGPGQATTRVATIYKAHPKKGLIPIRLYAPDPNRRLVLASGGLYTSVQDLAIFLQMHLNQGAYGSSRMLSPAAVAEMQKKQTGADQTEYGFGWFRDRVTKDGEALCIKHPGLFGAWIWIDKDMDLVGVFLTSSLWRGRNALHKELHEKVLELFPAGN